ALRTTACLARFLADLMLATAGSWLKRWNWKRERKLVYWDGAGTPVRPDKTGNYGHFSSLGQAGTPARGQGHAMSVPGGDFPGGKPGAAGGAPGAGGPIPDATGQPPVRGATGLMRSSTVFSAMTFLSR